jgi:hypothetical protein
MITVKYFTEGTSFTILASSIPDVERFSQATPHQCSCFAPTARLRAKTGHISGHLPVANGEEIACFGKKEENIFLVHR